MRLLHWVLAPRSLLPEFPGDVWGLPPEESFGDAAVSVLYSDVGGFYERCGPTPDASGWIATERRSAIWTVKSKVSQAKSVRFLDHKAVESLLQNEDAHIQQDMEVSSEQGPAFTFLPGDSQTEFQIKRFLISLDGTGVEPPKYFGATVVGPSSEMAFVIWTYEMKPDPSRLIVCRLRSSREALPLLIEAALCEARRVSAEIIEAWNLPVDLEEVVKQTDGKIVEREDHWPCMAWYGCQGVPELNRTGTAQWSNNNK